MTRDKHSYSSGLVALPSERSLHDWRAVFPPHYRYKTVVCCSGDLARWWFWCERLRTCCLLSLSNYPPRIREENPSRNQNSRSSGLHSEGLRKWGSEEILFIERLRSCELQTELWTAPHRSQYTAYDEEPNSYFFNLWNYEPYFPTHKSLTSDTVHSINRNVFLRV